MTAADADMIAVIGCGNPNRRDDGAGLEVIRLLNSRRTFIGNHQVHMLDAGTDGMAVMFAARGCTSLIVVDACRTGVEPGTLFEVPGQELESKLPHSFNLHDFRWNHALYAGRQIYKDKFPKDVTAYLIEARHLEFGIGLSSEVSQATHRAAEKIEQNILDRLAALQQPVVTQ